MTQTCTTTGSVCKCVCVLVGKVIHASLQLLVETNQ
jgi:hypothetical protein